jgi:hypothetical protein
MKLTEKLLRHPLPDQLKALLEKFDGDFDASHLRALKGLAGEPSFTRYEQIMLRRAYRSAQVKLERTHALDTAMKVVLNLKEEDPHSAWYSNPAQNPVGVTTTDLYQRRVDRKAHELKQKTERRMMGMPL